MRAINSCLSVALVALIVPTILPAGVAGAAEDEKVVRQILDASGVRGGLIVHLGCGDGRLTAALRAGEQYIVHGLDTDPAKVETARQRIKSLGLYGKVTADVWSGRQLPLVDNMVNLIVAEDAGTLEQDELMRALAPGGVALVNSGGNWTKTVKPRPAEMDEWTHYLHDSTNNAVGNDTLVGPPKHYQWIGSPDWLRHHDHMSGFSAMVTTAGRLFYIVDLGPRWSVEMPPRWTLIARDAFNGVVLWQRQIDTWHPHLWPLKKGPAQLMRRLVADGEVVYVMPGIGEPVYALEAATGRTITKFRGTEGAEELIHSDGMLLVLVNPEIDAYKDLPGESVDTIRSAGRDWNWDERPRQVAAIDARSGKTLWTKQSVVAPVTLTAAGTSVLFHDGEKVVCLDRKSGYTTWTSKPIPRWKPMHVLYGPSLVVHDDVVLFSGGEKMDPFKGGKDTMSALSADTGELLWTAPHPQSGYASSEDLLVVGGLVWCGVTTNKNDSGVFTGRDLHTGEVVQEFPPDDWPHMSHHRCYRAKATGNYILTSRTGIEFVDPRTEHWTVHHWVRGACNYGIMPANGLIYAPPHSCACYPVAKLNGFNALAPERREGEKGREGDRESETSRLQRGPAYNPPASSLQPTASSSSDWPTYRGNAGRTGSTEASVPVELERLWQTDIGGRLSAVVVAEGMALVAAVDRHEVHAVEAATGKPVWSFTAGGRVDSPPTMWQHRVLFGSADGYVYCLRAADGQLLWRYRCAPEDKRLMAREQLESAWPVHGSVLVREGVVYCIAGRSMWLDGGMHLLRLDATSGEKLSETLLDDKYPTSGDNLQTDLVWPNLPCALSDVLSCDGQFVYMRSQPFDLEGRRTEVFTTNDYREQQGDTAHLFSPTGFLDDSWWHRSYWMWGRSFIGGAGGWSLAAYRAPAGRILSVDETTVYGFGRAPLRVSGTPNTYHLFACDKQPELINSNQPSKKKGTSVYGPVVPTRLEYHWSESIPLLVRGMVATDDVLFAVGPPEVADEVDVYSRYGEPEIQAKMAEHVAAFEGGKGSVVVAVSKADGQKLAAWRLDSAPVFDGLSAAGGRLFMAGTDGTLVCLGSGNGTPLEEAADVGPGPVSQSKPGFSPTATHPDFQYLDTIAVRQSDIGYRMQGASQKTGLALKKLAKPLTGRFEFRLTVRTTPGAPTPDQPGNAFFAFGDAASDEHTVKCGYRISGKRLFVVQGRLSGGKAKSVPADLEADVVTELHVIVDLDNRVVSLTALGVTIQMPLERELKEVNWIGYAISSSIMADFSPIEIQQ